MGIKQADLPGELLGEFYLSTFPHKIFRVNMRASYMDERGTLQIVLDVQGYGSGDDDGVWRQFGRFNLADVKRAAFKVSPLLG